MSRETDSDSFGKRCIEGRRPTLGFGSVITSPLLAAWLAREKDEISYSSAGILILDKVASGLADFLNGTNAEITDRLIFDVETLLDIQSLQRTLNGAPLPKPRPELFGSKGADAVEAEAEQ